MGRNFDILFDWDLNRLEFRRPFWLRGRKGFNGRFECGLWVNLLNLQMPWSLFKGVSHAHISHVGSRTRGGNWRHFSGSLSTALNYIFRLRSAQPTRPLFWSSDIFGQNWPNARSQSANMHSIPLFWMAFPSFTASSVSYSSTYVFFVEPLQRVIVRILELFINLLRESTQLFVVLTFDNPLRLCRWQFRCTGHAGDSEPCLLAYCLITLSRWSSSRFSPSLRPGSPLSSPNTCSNFFGQIGPFLSPQFAWTRILPLPWVLFAQRVDSVFSVVRSD